MCLVDESLCGRSGDAGSSRSSLRKSSGWEGLPVGLVGFVGDAGTLLETVGLVCSSSETVSFTGPSAGDGNAVVSSFTIEGPASSAASGSRASASVLESSGGTSVKAACDFSFFGAAFFSLVPAAALGLATGVAGLAVNGILPACFIRLLLR